jgi:toxin ParE1/3/4
VIPVLTAPAELDLQVIWDQQVRFFDERRAQLLLTQIFRLIYDLEAFPELGRKREEIASGLRGLGIKDYVVLYTITTQGVTIMRVLHRRQDMRRIFP